MYEQVKRFISKSDKIIKEDRDNLLIQLGLVQKEYLPENYPTNDTYKYDYVHGEKRYFKEVALDVTEEEYAEIIKRVHCLEMIEEKNKSELDSKVNSRFIQTLVPIALDDYSTETNGLSLTLKIIAWLLWLLGFISGIIASGFFMFRYTIMIWISSFILGILIYAIARVIDHLVHISSLLHKRFKYSKAKK